MALTFRGGVCPDKQTVAPNGAIVEMPAPKKVILPLSHSSLKALVSVGDHVLLGQKIADGEGDVTPLHASVSGRVSAIGPRRTSTGKRVCIVLENDFKSELSSEACSYEYSIRKAKAESLIRHIREKGISDPADNEFPVSSKLTEAQGKATRIIINCMESDPAFTGTHRLLLEKTEEIIGGIKILMRAAGVEKAVFAMNDEQEDAAEAVMKLVSSSRNFVVAVLNDKHPQHDERILIRALLKKEIPVGASPLSVGAIFFTPETCLAVYRAFISGLPATTRLVTVGGNCIKTPSHLTVPLGTSFRDVIQFCGGALKKQRKVLEGGMMTGKFLFSTQIPVTKTTKSLLVTDQVAPKSVPSPCIRCGRCIDACPFGLVPMTLNRSLEKGDRNMALLYDVKLCTECGCCSYVCPAQIPLRENIAKGKKLLAVTEAEKGGKA